MKFPGARIGVVGQQHPGSVVDCLVASFECGTYEMVRPSLDGLLKLGIGSPRPSAKRCLRLGSCDLGFEIPRSLPKAFDVRLGERRAVRMVFLESVELCDLAADRLQLVAQASEVVLGCAACERFFEFGEGPVFGGVDDGAAEFLDEFDGAGR